MNMLSNLPLGVFGLPGYQEVIIVVLLILLLFGGRKLPELARGLARGLRIFRDEMKGVKEDVEKSVDLEEKQGEPPQPLEQSEQPEQEKRE